MKTKFLSLACLRGGAWESYGGGLSSRPHYPSMPKYPKGSTPDVEIIEGSESKAVFSVTGMTCSACAGSVEKAVKRLPGINEAVVDVLNNRAQVMFYPSFVTVEEETDSETDEEDDLQDGIKVCNQLGMQLDAEMTSKFANFIRVDLPKIKDTALRKQATKHR